jgi:hypothetical protein
MTTGTPVIPVGYRVVQNKANYGPGAWDCGLKMDAGNDKRGRLCKTKPIWKEFQV